jgi:hypothetical protein
VKEALSHEFKMKDLDEIEYCVGIQIIRNKTRRTISPRQLKYVGDILNYFGMETYKSIKTPLNVNVKLTYGMQLATKHEVKQMKVMP